MQDGKWQVVCEQCDKFYIAYIDTWLAISVGPNTILYLESENFVKREFMKKKKNVPRAACFVRNHGTKFTSKKIRNKLGCR